MSIVLQKEPDVVYKNVRWIINSAIGGLITFFVLAAFLNYFGYM